MAANQPIPVGAPIRLTRNSRASRSTPREEIEANAFAATLLMPGQVLRDHLNRLPASQRREPDTTAIALAKIFKVSTSALNFRLINLGLTS